MSDPVTRIEDCPAFGLGGHLWSIPSLRGNVIMRICLWCSEVRALSAFPEYEGTVLSGRDEIGYVEDGQFTTAPYQHTSEKRREGE